MAVPLQPREPLELLAGAADKAVTGCQICQNRPGSLRGSVIQAVGGGSDFCHNGPAVGVVCVWGGGGLSESVRWSEEVPSSVVRMTPFCRRYVVRYDILGGLKTRGWASSLFT